MLIMIVEDKIKDGEIYVKGKILGVPFQVNKTKVVDIGSGDLSQSLFQLMI